MSYSTFMLHAGGRGLEPHRLRPFYQDFALVMVLWSPQRPSIRHPPSVGVGKQGRKLFATGKFTAGQGSARKDAPIESSDELLLNRNGNLKRVGYPPFEVHEVGGQPVSPVEPVERVDFRNYIQMAVPARQRSRGEGRARSEGPADTV
jgi:hypothetical protein